VNHSEDKSNQGVIVSGGHITVRDMAVGEHAAITSTNVSSMPEELHTEVIRLVKLMEAEKVDPAQVAAARIAQQELEKDQPNEVVVSSILASVLESVKEVSAIAACVASISGIIFS